MRLGDDAHDREPEAGAARVVPGAAEPLERALREAVCKPVALVLDRQLHAPIGAGCPQRDAAPAVAERVVDEVAEGLLEPQAIAADGQARRRFARERPRRLVGPPLEARHD